MLQVKNLSQKYLQGETEILALQGVSFSLQKGRSLAITGPSGSGKTTLLSLLCGLETPIEGHILFEDKNLTKLNEEERTQFRAKNLGIVFQQFHLLPHLSALENVELPLEILNQDSVRERAMEALKKVGLESRSHHRPSQLSGGENQRVAIARAMVHGPSYIFADEPSGSLDTQTGKKVMDLLFDKIPSEGISLILVTHDESLAARCEQQLRLLGGRPL